MTTSTHGIDVVAEVQRRQRLLLARAQQRSRTTGTDEARTARWKHVPLKDLFAEYNALDVRGDGKVESGHEPFHASKSGRCVLIDPASGWWWCRSCRRSGDAATWVMAIHDVGYAEAASSLAERYGPPTGGVARRRSRRTPSSLSRTLWRSVL